MKQRKPKTKKSPKQPRAKTSRRTARPPKTAATLPDFHPLMHVEYREEQ